MRIIGVVLGIRFPDRIPSEISAAKGNIKNKLRIGLTHIYFVSYIYRISLDSKKRKDRFKPIFQSITGQWEVKSFKINLKRKNRKGSKDLYLLKGTIELEIDYVAVVFFTLTYLLGIRLARDV